MEENNNQLNEFINLCEQYFKQPTSQHPFHQYVTNSPPPEFITHILQFITSSNMYVTLFISNLLERHLKQGTLKYNYQLLIERLAPVVKNQSSLYRRVYSSLLVEQWENNQNSMVQSFGEFCNAFQQNSKDLIGLIFLVDDIIKEVTKRYDTKPNITTRLKNITATYGGHFFFCLSKT